MNSSGKSKVNWTSQTLMDPLRCKREAQVEMKWNKQTRGLRNDTFRKWIEMGYEHLQMQFFVKKLSDRNAKAERGSKTLKDHMKKQHMLSENAENSNPVQERESGRENARSRKVKCGKANFSEKQLSSKASGEHKAIQKQSKVAKRHVKRRKQISAKCKTLFVKDLTEFIEKRKSKVIKYS